MSGELSAERLAEIRAIDARKVELADAHSLLEQCMALRHLLKAYDALTARLEQAERLCQDADMQTAKLLDRATAAEAALAEARAKARYETLRQCLSELVGFDWRRQGLKALVMAKFHALTDEAHAALTTAQTQGGSGNGRD